MKESMTDYEKLIKEVRTLEGMYYNNRRIVQGIAYIDELSFVLQDDEDDIIYSSEDFMFFDDVLEALNKLDEIKKDCYKPLEVVQTINILTDESDDYLHHHNASHYLKNLSSDLTVKYVDNSDDLTDINLINKEIKRILDEKYN